MVAPDEFPQEISRQPPFAPEKFKTGAQVTIENGVTGSIDDELTETTTFTISK